ncbi:MAG: hypothetical protein SO286_00880 [Candidatus Enterosoma sp.]|nr:hypothetical protein [Candidatus Enterosoma sp.]
MTIEKKRTVTVQNDINVYFVPEEISALHRAMDILRGIADPNIYPNNETPSYGFNWDSAADIIGGILEEAEQNNNKVFLYSEEDGES